MSKYVWVDEAKTILNKIDDDGVVWQVTVDESNPEYQRYLNPKAEQSTPIVTNEAKTK